MFENLKEEDAKVLLLYRETSSSNNNDIRDMVHYLSGTSERMNSFDLSQEQKVNELCLLIEQNADDLDTVPA